MYLWKVTGEREREERLPRKSRYQTRRQFCFGVYNSCQEFAKKYIYIHVYKVGGESRKGTLHL